MSNARAEAAARRRAMQSAAAPAPAAPARTLGPTVVERFFNASFPNNAFRPRPAAAAVTGPTRLPSQGGARWQDTMFGGRAATVQPSQSGARWQDTMFGGRAAAGQPPASGSWAPAAQQNPRLPAGRNVAIVTPRSQGQNRALDQAAQNAGLPAWNWKAEENAAMLQAAQARESAAMAAREAQGGRGYITANNQPAALDQGQAAYWQGADMQAWAAANPKLAQAAMARAGYNPQQVTLAEMARTAAAQEPVSGPGVMNGPDWSFDNRPGGTIAPLAAAAAAAEPGYDFAGVTGPDFAAPAPASAVAFQGSLPAPDDRFPLTSQSVVPGGGQALDDPAQARLQDYLQRLKNLNPAAWDWNQRVG